jgi:hypothetical protein
MTIPKTISAALPVVLAPSTQAQGYPTKSIRLNMIVVHPALPIRTLAELTAYAKANPGKLNYASAGRGSLIHLTAELFKVATATDTVHVPYKGLAAHVKAERDKWPTVIQRTGIRAD